MKRKLESTSGASDYKLRHAAELPQQVEANLAALERLNTQLRLNGEYQLRASSAASGSNSNWRTPRGEARDAGAGADGGSPELTLRQQLADLTRYSERYPTSSG